MGYLSYVFNSYYSSDNDYEKEKLKNDFKQRLWESVPYKKIKKHFSFRVMKNHIATLDSFDAERRNTKELVNDFKNALLVSGDSMTFTVLSLATQLSEI